MRFKSNLKVLAVVLTLFTTAYGDVGIQKDYSKRQSGEMVGSLCGGLITGINVYSAAEGRSSRTLAGIGFGTGLILVGTAFDSESQYPILLALSGSATILSGVYTWKKSGPKTMRVTPALLTSDARKSSLGIRIVFSF
ncbi:MAG: hypothetical protein HQ556_08300 [Candidatus Marinimicrobia bacterium]|nr:hypothetical protein [Candidatus Neomarinimicrobiota bacterium]